MSKSYDLRPVMVHAIELAPGDTLEDGREVTDVEHKAAGEVAVAFENGYEVYPAEQVLTILV